MVLPRVAVDRLSARVGVAGIVLTAAGSAAAVASPALTASLLAVALLMVVAVWKPEVGISVWLVVTVFAPAWTVFRVAGISVTPSYLAIPVVCAVIARRLHERISDHSVFKFSVVDAGVIAGVALVLAFQTLFDQEAFLAINVVITLFGGYVLGRLAGVSVQRVFVISMVVVSVWGIAEFVWSWHAFTGWQADTLGIGPQIQQRGGLARSEATLGHAIAYGACLAAALPFAKLFKHFIVIQAVLCVGVLASLSRGPILAVVFTLLLMLYVERSAKHRVGSAVLLVAGLLMIYVVLTYLYNGSGQGELQSSGSARESQLQRALSYTNLFGPADGTQLSRAGHYVTNGVEIVDSAGLRLALDFGWVACVLLLLPVIVVVMRVILRRGGPATVALAGQVPVILVTSFITQWQVVIFFLAGLAVSEMVRSRQALSPVSSLRVTRS